MSAYCQDSALCYDENAGLVVVRYGCGNCATLLLAGVSQGSFLEQDFLKKVISEVLCQLRHH